MVKWTEEMDLILQEKVNEGLKAKDIAIYFSVNDRAIYTRMYSLGLHSKYKRPETSYTKEQILDIIKKNPSLVSRDYTIERKDLVPIHTIIKLFGSFSKAKKEAGVPEKEKEKISISKEDILLNIKSNPTFKAKDFTIKNGCIPLYKIIEVFGSFREAKNLAGIPCTREKSTKPSIKKVEYRYIRIPKEPLKNIEPIKDIDKKLAKVYLISFDKFYKVGITTQNIAARFNKLPVAYEVVLYIELPIEEARSLEKYWLKSIRPFCTKEVLEELKYFDGKTECFIFG
jgi:hypothetical protein